ncbi:hypothetical protein D3C75_848880 [compost metagenome]
MGAHLVLGARLGAFARHQHFELQAGGQHGDAFALGVFDQVVAPGLGSLLGLGGLLRLHALADHLEAGVHRLVRHAAVGVVVGVRQTGEDGFQAGAGRRVVTQLTTELAADAVADAGFVGGKVELGHGNSTEAEKMAGQTSTGTARPGRPRPASAGSSLLAIRRQV